MALSDLQIYSEYAYRTMTEVLDQKVELFNAASGGTIQLDSVKNQGDYNDEVFFKKISGGTVRRRNAYGSGAVGQKTITQGVDTSVKIAAGTYNLTFDPSDFKWIQMDPAAAGAAMGQQIAVDEMADMLNTTISAGYTAMSQVADIVYDATADTPDTLTPTSMNKATALFGDRSSEIQAWVVHSKPMHDFYGNAISNDNRLFTYERINVIRDPFGRLFIVNDSPSLLTAGAPDVYHCLGLTSGAMICQKNGDFLDNWETKNGQENISTNYQAEWSYNLSIKGFSWDKTAGGPSPNDAAINTSTNWVQNVTSTRDLGGVILEVN